MQAPFSRRTPILQRLSRGAILALFLLPLSLTSTSPSFAEEAAKPAAKPDQTPKIAPNLTHFTLGNGLEVVVIPDHRAPVVTHMIWYKVGGADEPEGESGVAHFLEHLMFKGTKAHPDGDFSRIVAELGGSENAFTTADYTAYFQRVAKQHLPLMMELEADRMTHLQLTDEVINPERQVVLEERRMRVENNPSSKLNEALTAITFVNHPYGSPVIGWESEIKALNKDAVIDFYNRFYTPNNAVVIVAGDVDPDEVKALAEKTYGQVARRAEPGARKRPQEPPLAGERRISLADPRVTQESVSMTWIVPSVHTSTGDQSEALDLLSYILGGSATSRLHQLAVLDRKIAVGAGSFYQQGSLDDGRFGFYASPKDGNSLADMEAMIQEVLDDVLENGISDEELAKAKHSLIADTIYAQDSQQSLAQIFGSSLAIGMTVEDVQTWPAKINSVTKEDVLEVARKYLSGPAVYGRLEKEKPKMGGGANADDQKS